MELRNARAKKAYKFVNAVKGKSYSNNYKQYIKKLGPMIQSNGIGNAIAFVYSNASENGSDRKKAYYKVYEQLEFWLKECDLIEKNEELLAKVMEVNKEEYRAILNETMLLLNWWRKLADGVIEDNSQ